MWQETGGGCSVPGAYPERLWDPRPGQGSFTDVTSAGTEHTSCSGFTHLADGSILSAGGAGYGSECGVSSKQATKYSRDALQSPWTSRAPMPAARWYPSALTLPDGRVLMMLGNTEPNGSADPYLWPGIYDP